MELTQGLPGPEEQAFYHRQGFLIVRNIITPEELQPLRSAAERYREACLRTGKAKMGDRRLNLVSDELPEEAEISLINVAARARILRLSEVLSRGPLKSNGYFMNISEEGQETTMGWHQDEKFLPADRPAAFNVKVFTREVPFSQIQWNLPLYDDAALWIIPGSQLRDSSGRELEAMAKDVYDPGLTETLRVDLKAGDGVVYHNNLIHSLNDTYKRKRRTLHWYWVKKEAFDPYDLAKVTIPPGLRPKLDKELQKLI